MCWISFTCKFHPLTLGSIQNANLPIYSLPEQSTYSLQVQYIMLFLDSTFCCMYRPIPRLRYGNLTYRLPIFTKSNGLHAYIMVPKLILSHLMTYIFTLWLILIIIKTPQTQGYPYTFYRSQGLVLRGVKETSSWSTYMILALQTVWVLG